MGMLVKLVVGAVVAFALFMGAVALAGDLGGEVVILTTSTEGGNRDQMTKLWIVDDHGQMWIRAGQPNSSWFLQLQAEPQVRLERGGETSRYRAVVVPKQRERINRLMAERYGWADWLIGVVRTAEETQPIRLDPIR